MDFFETKSPILNEVDAQEDKAEAEEDSEIVSLIKELLEERVRPAVAMDGGDIIYHSFIDGVVFVKLQGSCSGCPSSLITLKQGIENMLKYYIPEVKEVQSID
jgi:Fe-S cluster biogenesis protein NfuA